MAEIFSFVIASMMLTMAVVSLAQIDWQSVIVKILTLKVTLFFYRLSPAIRARSRRSPRMANVVACGAVHRAGAGHFCAIAGLSGIVGAYFQRQTRAALYLNRFAGCAFVGLGIRIALPE